MPTEACCALPAETYGCESNFFFEPTWQGASIPTHFSLPSNLESMSVQQLKAIAAAHGIDTTATRKDALVAAIERERFRDEPQVSLSLSLSLSHTHTNTHTLTTRQART